jgi:hypothetical protein
MALDAMTRPGAPDRTMTARHPPFGVQTGVSIAQARHPPARGLLHFQTDATLAEIRPTFVQERLWRRKHTVFPYRTRKKVAEGLKASC